MSEEEITVAEVLNLLEAEPSSGPAGVGVVAAATATAVLVAKGKAKEAIGMQLTHEQVKRLSDKDVEKYYKRYETWDD